MTTLSEIQIRPMTADELLHLPDDGMRSELVKGELRKMAPAGNEHGRLAVNATVALAQHVKEQNLGTVFAAETGYIIHTDPDTVRAPDVSFLTRERVEAAGRVTGFWQGPPDLAVEVISPSEIYAEVEEKVLDWLQAGTRMVVVVNPHLHVVTVYRSLTDIVVLTDRDTLDGGDVAPGWRMSVADIFA